MVLLCRQTLVLTGWRLGDDGAVRAEVQCRVCGVAASVRLAPSTGGDGVFSEHLALVAATFTLAFENRALEAGRPSVHRHVGEERTG